MPGISVSYCREATRSTLPVSAASLTKSIAIDKVEIDLRVDETVTAPSNNPDILYSFPVAQGDLSYVLTAVDVIDINKYYTTILCWDILGSI